MPDYEFSLNINNEGQTINRRSGFGISSLGNLLSGLSLATNPGDNSLCILDRIDNHGYTPHFFTQSYDRYRLFINVHRKLIALPISELSREEQRYAGTLKKVLTGGKFLQARDGNNTEIVRINPDLIGKGRLESYHIVTTVHGVIRQIGGRNLTRGTHIMLNGLPYKVMTTAQQDALLGSFYKGAKLRLRIRQKCSLEDGHVLYGVLLDFQVHSNHTLLEGVSQLGNIDFIQNSAAE